MASQNRTLADDPLGFIQACVRSRKILWTYHVNLRLKDRFVPREAILDAVDSYEIVESYPDDKCLPSYLVLGRPTSDPVHILFAIDVAGDNVRVVTVYRPNVEEWESDLKTRRRSR